MELKQLKSKSADELKAHLVELQQRFALRMQKATSQLARPTRPAACAEIARVNTLLGQKK